ncbi:MAG: non-homologous end-joining DNA ligase [Actinomycetota bacterium]
MPEAEVLEIDGRDVKVTNPDKVFFPKLGVTKLDLVGYYLSVAEGALVGCGNRPVILHRFPNGVDGDDFHQKRAPQHRPEWIQTVTISFPSGRTADELVVADAAHLAWMINLGCIDINPWPIRASDVDHPDELRIDLDPTPEAPWSDVRNVALVVREVLADVGLTGFPKTSGKRGIHVPVRIEPRWEFPEVRRAALALAREVERRAPDIATSAWWKEERHGVFVDYNQNARDRTTASAYSVRPVPAATVSTPLTWDEVPDVEMEDFRIDTVPDRFRKIGDPGRGIDEEAGTLDQLLALADLQEQEGAEEGPLPPHFPKAPGEPTRAPPSRRKRPSGAAAKKSSRKRSARVQPAKPSRKRKR